MPDDLSRTIEADLGPILAPLASTQREGLTGRARGGAHAVAVARPRRRFSAASVGAYAATALLGTAIGLLFAGSGSFLQQPAPAGRSEGAEPPSQLQVVLAAPAEVQPRPETAASPTPRLRGPTGPSDAPAPPAHAAPPTTPPNVTLASREALRIRQVEPAATVAPPGGAVVWDAPPAPAPEFREAQRPIPEQPCDEHCLAYRLDEADRALAAAYQEARRAGVPARELRARARAWTDERNVAAAVSGVALLDAFENEREALASLTGAWTRRGLE